MIVKGSFTFFIKAFQNSDTEKVLFFEKSILLNHLLPFKPTSKQTTTIATTLFFSETEKHFPFCKLFTKSVKNKNKKETQVNQIKSLVSKIPFPAASKCHAKLMLLQNDWIKSGKGTYNAKRCEQLNTKRIKTETKRNGIFEEKRDSTKEHIEIVHAP